MKSLNLAACLASDAVLGVVDVVYDALVKRGRRTPGDLEGNRDKRTADDQELRN